MVLPDVYESSDLTAAIGVSPIFLNRLVERGLHGVKPSLRADVSTGGRRWFSKEDVFGVALVYWLFEAGLRAGSGKARTSVIQDVLDQIAQKRNATANDAAKRLYETDTAVLVIIQELYPDNKGKRRKRYVRLMNEEDPLAADPYDVEIYIPVGNLLVRLDDVISKRK
jgi:hypothetical protein